MYENDIMPPSFYMFFSACSFVFICLLQIGYYLDRGCPKWVGEDTQEEEEGWFTSSLHFLEVISWTYFDI